MAGVRDHVAFIDECRVKHGMDRVLSLTPKVETRLRSGDQANIPLQVQYTNKEAGLALVLTLQMDYPASAIEVQVVDGAARGVDAGGSEDGSEDAYSAEDNEEGGQSGLATNPAQRAANLSVLQLHLQRYCNSLVCAAGEENDWELQERMRKLAETLDSKAAAATALPAVSLAAAAAVRPAPAAAFNGVVGVEVIEKFNNLAARCRNEELKLDTLGNVVARVFQFAGLAEKVNAIQTEEAGSSSDGDDEATADLPAASYKCAKCRTLLFTTAQMDRHEMAKPKKGETMAKDSKGRLRVVRHCSSKFLADHSAPPSHEEATAQGLPPGLRRVTDPGNSSSDDSGALVCSKCNTKAGAWSWVGLQCSCQTWVCPAYMVNDSKVDECL